MKITEYTFGKLKIDGSCVNSDVIVFPDSYQDSWWRKQGHVLHVEDLQKVIEYHPQVLVVGTGYYGRMKVPDETQQYLREQGIKLHFSPTSEAVREFNELQKQYARIVAALHLTC